MSIAHNKLLEKALASQVFAMTKIKKVDAMFLIEGKDDKKKIRPLCIKHSQIYGHIKNNELLEIMIKFGIVWEGS